MVLSVFCVLSSFPVLASFEVVSSSAFFIFRRDERTAGLVSSIMRLVLGTTASLLVPAELASRNFGRDEKLKNYTHTHTHTHIETAAAGMTQVTTALTIAAAAAAVVVDNDARLRALRQ